MINKNSGNDIAMLMKQAMRPKFPTQEENFSIILNHLNSAAEAFDEAGNSKCAELVTQIMTNFAGQLHPRE